MAKVWIPALMRDLTDGQTVVTVRGSTVRQIIDNLEAAYPGTKSRLVSGDSLKPGIGVAIDGDMARYGLTEKVRSNTEIHFLPAVSGGGSEAERAQRARPSKDRLGGPGERCERSEPGPRRRASPAAS